MVKQIPDRIYGPVEHVAERISHPQSANPTETNPRCVYCALEGTSMPLSVFYIVNGNSACTTHAKQSIGATQ